jgi:hypothetical protein
MTSSTSTVPIMAMVTMLSVVSGSSASLAAPAMPASPPWNTTYAGFCIAVQRHLVDTPLPIDNRLHTDKDAFTASKASAEPLTTHQFLERDAAGRVRGISCKTKSADHLRAVHGPAAARDPALAPRSCRDVQRRIVMDVWQGLDGVARAGAPNPPQRLMLDPDARSYTGSSWIGSPAEAYLADDGRVHLRASALFAEWTDWRWKLMPTSWRGNHYCHLVAPERVERLMLGAERLTR